MSGTSEEPKAPAFLPMDMTTEPRRPRALEDPSGRRLRRMRWVGRGVALVFLVWFGVILLGALGVGPVGRVPFGNTLRPSAGPPPLRGVPAPRRPSRSDLLPALPATVFASMARSRMEHRAIGHMTATAKVRGHSSSAPGHVTVAKTRGHSASAPGHTTTTVPRRSFAPGFLRRVGAKTTKQARPVSKSTETTTTTPKRGHAAASTP